MTRKTKTRRIWQVPVTGAVMVAGALVSAQGAYAQGVLPQAGDAAAVADGAVPPDPVAAAAPPPGPQGLNDGPLLAIDFAAGIDYEDNLDERDEFEISARVGLSYFTSSSNQRLSYDIGVNGELNETRLEFTDPAGSFSYAIFSRQVELGVDLSFSSVEVDGADLDDDFDTDELADTDGQRDDIGAQFSVVTGRFTPFGTTTVLSYDEQNFRDGSDQDDERLVTLQSTLRFTVDPRIEFRLIGEATLDETDDDIDSRDRILRLTAEADLLINPVWSATVGLGFADLETDTTLGTTSNDAIEARLLLVRDMRNGTLTFSADRTLNTEDVRETYSVARSLGLAHGADVTGRVGLTRFESGDVEPLASLDYMLPLPRGSIVFGFNYEGDITDDDEKVRRTQLGATYNQDLTRTSSWSIDGALASVDNTDVAIEDTLRVDLGLTYIQALTSDWNLAARLSHQAIFEGGDLDDRTSTISLVLERRFVFRP